ncbi:hypothetical protein PPROV_000624900 [Pycnococcus provasolii]|uniref:Uncharacterized protein n=1 Tax=Pycnococcus provasolii TaxID=41880 RepID=A0A830HRA4_9CHLO|nr:hypothetical protein PPROV_000624900 [Pycnococcus provasolii]
MSSSPTKSLLSVPPLRLEKVPSPDRMANFYGPPSFHGPASTGSGPPSMRGRPSTPRPKRPPPPPPPASNAGLVDRPGVVAPSTLTDALRDVVVSATAPQGVRVRVPWRAVNVLLDLLSEAKSGEARVLEKHGWAKGKTWPTQGDDVATLSALVDDIEALNKPASNNKTPPGRSPPPSPPPQQKQAKPEKLAAAAALFDDDDDDDDLLDSILGKPTPVSELRTTAAPLSARGPPPAATRTQYAPHPPLTSRPLPPSPTMPTTSPTKQAAHVAAVGVLSVDDDDDDDLFDDLFANTPTPPPPSRVVAPPSPIPHLPPANNGHATTKQTAGGGGDDDSDWSSDEDAEDFFNANPSGIAHGGGSKKNGKKRSPFAIKLNASPTALPTTTVPILASTRRSSSTSYERIASIDAGLRAASNSLFVRCLPVVYVRYCGCPGRRAWPRVRVVVGSSTAPVPLPTIPQVCTTNTTHS